jgi:hypothetical protein
MNLNALNSLVQSSVNALSRKPDNDRQVDIAATIGNAKSQQIQKMQFLQQIDTTLQKRQSTSQPASQKQNPANSKDDRYSFSIYV